MLREISPEATKLVGLKGSVDLLYVQKSQEVDGAPLDEIRKGWSFRHPDLPDIEVRVAERTEDSILFVVEGENTPWCRLCLIGEDGEIATVPVSEEDRVASEERGGTSALGTLLVKPPVWSSEHPDRGEVRWEGLDRLETLVRLHIVVDMDIARYRLEFEARDLTWKSGS